MSLLQQLFQAQDLIRSIRIPDRGYRRMDRLIKREQRRGFLQALVEAAVHTLDDAKLGTVLRREVTNWLVLDQVDKTVEPEVVEIGAALGIDDATVAREKAAYHAALKRAQADFSALSTSRRVLPPRGLSDEGDGVRS